MFNAGELTFHTVELCRRPIRRAFQLLSHYFLRIESLDLEIHPGNYSKGTHCTINAKSVYTVVESYEFCTQCIDEMLNESLNMINVWYYPIINCETLSRGLCKQLPVSYQTITLSAIIVSIVCCFVTNSIVLLFFVLYLLTLYNNVKLRKIKLCEHSNTAHNIA